MEANSTFSLVEEKEPKPGLCLMPGWDEEFRQEQPVAAGTFACLKCGQVVEAPQKPSNDCPTAKHGNGSRLCWLPNKLPFSTARRSALTLHTVARLMAGLTV